MINFCYNPSRSYGFLQEGDFNWIILGEVLDVDAKHRGRNHRAADESTRTTWQDFIDESRAKQLAALIHCEAYGHWDTICRV